MLSLLAGVLVAGLLHEGVVADPGPPEGRPIPLQLVDVQVRPGQFYVVSIRTCQPRGVSRGEILIRNLDDPFPVVRRSHLFTREGDGVLAIDQSETDELGLTLFSPSASINTQHGPLLALLLRAPANTAVGHSASIEIDPLLTFLFDDLGIPALFTVRDARMTVIDENAPMTLALEDLDGFPGSRTTLVLSTSEFHRLASAELLVRYDPTVLINVLDTIIWDLRGDLDVLMEQPEPGALRFRLVSPSSFLNVLPGPMVEITFSISPDVTPGQTSTLLLDPAMTSIVTKEGSVPSLELRPAILQILPRNEGDC
jgi:hypothetical protein